MKIFPQLADKKILVLGFGREGLSTFRFLRKRFPRKILGVADKNLSTKLSQGAQQLLRSDHRIQSFFGDEYLSGFAEYDVIFKSSGISPHFVALQDTLRSGTIITSNIALFFELCPGKIVGVTGTKGKSTTTSLIYDVLKAGKLPVRLAGNIGVPALDVLAGAMKKTVFVVELSSYQLASLSQSPDVAVVQNIVQEHMDYHKTFEAYVEAKSRITFFQKKSNVVVYNASHSLPKKIAQMSPGKKIPFSSVFIFDHGCFFDDGWIVYHEAGKQHRILPVSEIPLRGDFNRENVMPAVVVGKIFRVSQKAIVLAVKNFRPLPHRLEPVGKIGDVEFYNDSLSTVPEASIAALKSFPNHSVVLMAGGFDRQQDYREFAAAVLSENVRGLVLFPTTGKRIWQEIVKRAKMKHTLPLHVFVDDMPTALEKAYEFSGGKNGHGVVLLSPASPSFGVFRDYADRGDQFRSAVQKLIAFQ